MIWHYGQKIFVEHLNEPKVNDTGINPHEDVCRQNNTHYS